MSTSSGSSSRGAKGQVAPARPVLRYEVREHQVRITQLQPGRWAVALDEQELPGSFDNRADAWEAGVREADRRDAAR